MSETRPPATSDGLTGAVVRLFRDAFETFWTLAKVMVPVIIVTRLLQQSGVVDALGNGLGPVMHVVGLPGSMGLVWATSLIINMYGGIVVFASLAPAASLTVAQVTVLASLILVAHGLPVELRIAQKAGPRIRAIAPLRILAALLLAWILHRTCSALGVLQETCNPLIRPSQPDPAWTAWGLAQLRTLAMIFVIILALLAFLGLLKRLRITDLLLTPLMPVFRALGIGPGAAPVTVVGLTLGLTYGGGLIIREAQSGKLSSRDVFFSLALLSLCHSLIEDTLLMMAIGAHISGVLFARVLFSLAVVFVLARLFARMPDEKFERLLTRRATPQEKTEDGRAR
jgi:hypothetical protein